LIIIALFELDVNREIYLFRGLIGRAIMRGDERVSSGKGFVAESSNGFCFTRILAITADALDGEWWGNIGK